MEYRFLLQCKCGWTRYSTGISEDLKDLHEIVKCGNCGGPRKFKCPTCHKIVKQTRIKGNT